MYIKLIIRGGHIKNLEEHKEEIIKILELSKDVPVFYGEKAKNFFDKYGDFKRSSKINGVFLCENLPTEYKDTGVICMFIYDAGTLAHELKHAKQWQTNYLWIQKRKSLKYLYKCCAYTKVLYYYHPAEKQAFTFALNYLKKEKIEEPKLQKVYNDYKWRVWGYKWCLPAAFILFIVVFVVFVVNVVSLIFL